MSEIKTFSYDDLSAHSSRKSLYLAISGKVYDCTKFIDEHPGGEEVLIDEAGKDATESFDDVGHSDEARDMLTSMYVGDLKDDGSKKGKSPAAKSPASGSDSGSTVAVIIAVATVASAVAYKLLL
ncbi:hypothetical protein BGZ76_009028 [Entomortierella beljakovae]|nr:hypothetical protein BGZ76_009028 [Entomortierella beljakovae]